MNKEDEIRKKFTLAEKLFAEKNVEDSIKLYKEILSMNPKILPAINNLGAAYESLNDLSQAEKYYLECYKINSSELVFINNLGNIFFK